MTKRLFLTTTCIIGLMAIPLTTQAQQNPTGVFVANVEKKNIVDTIEALGTLQSNENIVLTSTVTELITAIHFDDGQLVSKGDILLEMDAAEEQAELNAERAVYEEAKKQLERIEPLVKRGAASQSVLDERTREMNTSKARIEAIQSRINQRIIKAPFDGVIGLRQVSVGTLLQPGTVITTLDDTSTMKLDFNVTELYIPALQKNAVLKAYTKTYPDKIFNAQITAVDARIDPVTRSVTARAFLDNSDGLLKPGMLMRVNLEKNPRDALIIPEEAVISNSDANYVYRVDNETAVKKNVELGTRQQGKIEVLSGLEDGEKIVTHGAIKINDGAAVTIKGDTSGDKSVADLIDKKGQAQGEVE